MNRTERFGFALAPEEMTALTWLAEVSGGLSRAAVLRRLIRQEARSYGLWPFPQVSRAQRPEEEEDDE